MKNKQKWYFTFGCGQWHDGCFVSFLGTETSTRQKMFNTFGAHWSFQYSEKQWKNPDIKTILHRGLDPKTKPTLAEVWGWKELKKI